MIEQFRGLVRPLVTYAIVASLIYGFVTKLITAETFLPIVVMIIVFWFESREKTNSS